MICMGFQTRQMCCVLSLTCVGLLTAAFAENFADMSTTAGHWLPVMHSMDTGAGDFTRPCDCYAGFQEIFVPRLTSHMHSGAPTAVHPNHTLLMLLPLPDTTPRNKTTIEAVNVKRAPFALGSLPIGEEPSPVLAACLIHDIVALS